jgi:hypothetical protein
VREDSSLVSVIGTTEQKNDVICTQHCQLLQNADSWLLCVCVCVRTNVQEATIYHAN